MKIDAEIAETQHERDTGLMYRKSLAQDQGMLFVFAKSSTECFWMQNTLIPLDVAFIDAYGHIISTASMQAETTATHCPPSPYRYALEMPLNWFASHHATSSYVAGIPKATHHHLPFGLLHRLLHLARFFNR